MSHTIARNSLYATSKLHCTYNANLRSRIRTDHDICMAYTCVTAYGCFRRDPGQFFAQGTTGHTYSHAHSFHDPDLWFQSENMCAVRYAYQNLGKQFPSGSLISSRSFAYRQTAALQLFAFPSEFRCLIPLYSGQVCITNSPAYRKLGMPC